ncbi:MAG: CHAT domain-containing protein, partial [Cyanobacteria bacterium]|nr:CHAT domain-containing protein [Cyanobacteria bacterium GSL.Bin21]
QLAQARAQTLAFIEESPPSPMIVAERSRSTRRLSEVVKKQKRQLQVQQQAAKEQALRYTRRSLETATGNHRIQAQLLALEQGAIIARQASQILGELNSLPLSRVRVQQQIQLSSYLPEQQISVLQVALRQAKALNAPTLQVKAQLHLARGYQERENLAAALSAVNQAQLLAQRELNFPLLYQGQRLAAQLYRQTGQRDRALSSYQQASQTLEQLEGKVADEAVFYRNYLQLLLSSAQPDQLKRVLALMSRLRIAQLENYLGFPCPNLELESPQLPEKRARITTLTLPDQTYLFLQLPTGKIQSYTIPVAKSVLEKTVTTFQQQIYHLVSVQHQVTGKQLYDWLIAPIESELSESEIETLIFNHDNSLRNLPMTALYNGENYLIEDYAIANTLSVDRIERPSQSLNPLIVGISHPRRGNNWLPNVAVELEQVQALVGGKQLLNTSFTSERLHEQLQKEKFNALHIASHGIFGGILDTSYLLAYDRPVSMREFFTLLSNHPPLQLLVLSACETAMGNQRSVLGMAGIGVQTGARSVLGTLWSLPDNANTVELITDFYRHFDQDRQAEALQEALVEQIQEGTPVSHWASLILLLD